MARATTRKATIKPYLPCRTCEFDIPVYGKCKNGYDNFYYRKSKNNGCEKCIKSQNELYWSEILSRLDNRKK